MVADRAASLPTKPISIRAPLARPLFRMLWIANLFSATGSWMHDAAASWYMTSIAPSPAMVALVQTATMLPMFFLALPAGAMADIIDRRHYLLIAQSWMLATAATLGILTLSGVTDASLLLIFTFFMGVGSAMALPAFAATLPDLVPRQELLAAVTLNGVAMNVTRAIGPALGGFLIGLIGPGGIFTLNAVTFCAMLFVIRKLPRSKRETTLPSERLLGAVRVGARFALQSPVLKRVIIRGCLFYFSAIVLLALMPVLVRTEMQGSATTYGFILSAFGAGAVIAALSIPRLSAKFTRDQMLTTGMLAFAVALAPMAFARSVPLLIPCVLLAGMAWMTTLASFQVATQTSLPLWVRARGLAIFLMTLMGCMAAGSATWGIVARAFSIEVSFIAASLLILISTFAFRKLSVETHDVDLSPVISWPDPSVAMPLEGERGPVLVTVIYQVKPEDRETFIALMPDLRQVRRRNGSYSWSIFQDVADPALFTECFLDENWFEHLRHQRRVTVTDEVVLDKVAALHAGDAPPLMRHAISQPLPRPDATIF